MALKQVPSSSGKIKGIGKVGVFDCFEDEEHTARCVAAIRRRKKVEAQAHLVEIRR